MELHRQSASAERAGETEPGTDDGPARSARVLDHSLEQRRRNRRAIAAEAVAVEEIVESGDLAAAAKAIVDLQRRHGSDAPIEILEEKLRGRHPDEDEVARALAAERRESAAEVLSDASSVESLERDHAVLVATAEIEDLIRHGELDRADECLDRLKQEHGDDAPILELEARLEEAREAVRIENAAFWNEEVGRPDSRRGLWLVVAAVAVVMAVGGFLLLRTGGESAGDATPNQAVREAAATEQATPSPLAAPPAGAARNETPPAETSRPPASAPAMPEVETPAAEPETTSPLPVVEEEMRPEPPPTPSTGNGGASVGREPEPAPAPATPPAATAEEQAAPATPVALPEPADEAGEAAAGEGSAIAEDSTTTESQTATDSAEPPDALSAASPAQDDGTTDEETLPEVDLSAPLAFSEPSAPAPSPVLPADPLRDGALPESVTGQSARPAEPRPELLVCGEAGVSCARPVSVPAPAYPNAARAQRLTGTVVVKVLVDPEGRVTAAEVERRSRFRAFDEAAVEAAARARFEPARFAGEPGPSWAHLSYTFDPDR